MCAGAEDFKQTGQFEVTDLATILTEASTKQASAL